MLVSRYRARDVTWASNPQLCPPADKVLCCCHSFLCIPAYTAGYVWCPVYTRGYWRMPVDVAGRHWQSVTGSTCHCLAALVTDGRWLAATVTMSTPSHAMIAQTAITCCLSALLNVANIVCDPNFSDCDCS